MASRSPGFSYQHVRRPDPILPSPDQALLIFPRKETTIEIHTLTPKRIWPLDAGTVLLVPRGLSFEIECHTETCDVVYLSLSQDMIHRVSEGIKIGLDRVEDLKQSCAKVLRNQHLDSLIENFQHQIATQTLATTDEIEILGHQIVEETFKTLFPHSQKPEEKP